MKKKNCYQRMLYGQSFGELLLRYSLTKSVNDSFIPLQIHVKHFLPFTRI